MGRGGKEGTGEPEDAKISTQTKGRSDVSGIWTRKKVLREMMGGKSVQRES